MLQMSKDVGDAAGVAFHKARTFAWRQLKSTVRAEFQPRACGLYRRLRSQFMESII